MKFVADKLIFFKKSIYSKERNIKIGERKKREEREGEGGTFYYFSLNYIFKNIFDIYYIVSIDYLLIVKKLFSN